MLGSRVNCTKQIHIATGMLDALQIFWCAGLLSYDVSPGRAWSRERQAGPAC